MKNNKLSLGMCAALLLSSTLAMAESDYPAADFQPQVLFTDEGANDTAVKNQPVAKAISAAVAAKPASGDSSASTSAKTSVTAESSVAPKSDDSDSTMLIGLLALAAVGGFLFYKKQGGATASSSGALGNQYSFTKDSSGLSGVARYLKSREMLSASGVERYLAKQQEVTAAKKATASASSSAATGVEKYLKNKG